MSIDQLTGGNIEPRGLEEEMRSSYLDYAMSVIVGRALPDVRDGLKPVHRRVLFSMHEAGLQPNRPFRKASRVVGDVMGQFHPHGDSAIYDTLVRLGQDFAMRYPLVEPQGNFGSIDNDPAAAMRYTEARLSRLATEMLRDIDADTVDFGPNYDESRQEPLVLPSRFPNLLVNGASGIAVGMATNIPPHNLRESIDAVVAYIDDPDIDVDGLMKHIKGPDFPTGGIIVGHGGIREAYETGRGRVVIRGKAHIEPMERGKERIIVTEMPYQVPKGDGRGDGSGLIKKIAEQVQNERIKEISDLRDESDRSGIRLVIELKRDVLPEGRAQQALQAHAAADDLRREHGRARRRRAAHARPAADRQELRRPPARGHRPAHPARAERARGAAAHPRGPARRDRRHRRGDQPDPLVDRPRRRARRPDGARSSSRASRPRRSSTCASPG